MKRQPIEWEKTLVNDISDEGLVHKICKELMAQQEKKIHLKWVGDLKICFQKAYRGQQIHEKVLNIPSHQGKASQNHIC